MKFPQLVFLCIKIVAYNLGPQGVNKLGHQNDGSVYVAGLLEAKEYDFGSSAVHALSGLLLTSMALVLFAAVSYQCAATWKWLKTLGMSEEEAQEGCPDGVKQSSIRISHSLPDLQQEPTRHEYVQEKDNKKVSN